MVNVEEVVKLYEDYRFLKVKIKEKGNDETLYDGFADSIPANLKERTVAFLRNPSLTFGLDFVIIFLV